MCTISDKGIDFTSDVITNMEDPLGSVANAVANIFTMGLVGVENGKIGGGVTVQAGKGVVRAVDEGLGEVTGRNIARKQAMETKDAMAAAKAEAEKQRRFGVQQQEAQERQMSGRAAQQSRRAQGGATGTSGVEQQMATQFLGL